MRIIIATKNQRQQGAILAYFIMVGVFVSAIAALGAFVWTGTNNAHRRGDMIAAQQYAEGGAVVACAELKSSFSSTTGAFPANLTTFSYALSTDLSTNGQKVYQRTISLPFTNQTVTAQIWIPPGVSPSTARVVASATVGGVTQQATANLDLTFAYPAAIISDNLGTTSSGVDKNTGEAGNVVVNGAGKGALIVDGNKGMAVMANGMVNVDNTNNATVPASSISATNRNTADSISTNLTTLGTNGLFDFARFIALANATTNLLNAGPKNNHFTNVLSFSTAMTAAINHTLEGVVVVDISKSDGDWQKAGDATLFPFGINIHGTLFYNFGPEFGILDKFIVNTDLNINAANLTGLVPTDPSTYTSGYPAAYSDPSKNPTNINIVPQGFANVLPTDDLPALMYNIGEVDIHGNVDISGVCYSPSYMEIENKGPNGSIQYFKGSLIMGNGIYYENNNASTSIISFDPAAIDSLTTLDNRGKTVSLAYWQ